MYPLPSFPHYNFLQSYSTILQRKLTLLKFTYLIQIPSILLVFLWVCLVYLYYLWICLVLCSFILCVCSGIYLHSPNTKQFCHQKDPSSCPFIATHLPPTLQPQSVSNLWQSLTRSPSLEFLRMSYKWEPILNNCASCCMYE